MYNIASHSAGIGRSGVFVLVHSTLVKLRQMLSSSAGPTFDIKQSVLRMRDSRVGLIQTAVTIIILHTCVDLTFQEQFEFCYRSLLDKLIDIQKMLGYKNEK
jgi:protein tyrosine phosphatase